MLKMPIHEMLYDRPFSHCATLAELHDGTLMAVWMSGYYETSLDVALLASTLAPNGTRWSEPRVIADIAQKSPGQPVVLPRPDGDLWHFFVAIMKDDWHSAIPFLQTSSDGGQTWSAPRKLLDYPGLMFRSRAYTYKRNHIHYARFDKDWVRGAC